jgi:hypothetical protein
MNKKVLLRGKLTKLATGALALLMTPGFTQELQVAVDVFQAGGDVSGMILATGKILTSIAIAYGATRASADYGDKFQGIPRLRVVYPNRIVDEVSDGEHLHTIRVRQND